MEKHYGQIVEYIVRKNGYSITELAARLDVNRRTIYNYFQNAYLKQEIINKIGHVVGHDFSKEFPELFTEEQYESKHGLSRTSNPTNSANEENLRWKDKYIKLLEELNISLLTLSMLITVLGNVIDISEYIVL